MCKSTERCDRECCCNCANQIQLLKHPLNESEHFKGQISESSGFYLCVADMNADGNSNRSGYVLEDRHGMCEMHEPINRTIKIRTQI
jgi:hypothetical protein